MLQVEPVGIRDSFFELGGHSLLATQIASRIRMAFHMELPLRRLFEAPTVEGLAATILERGEERERMEHTAELLLRFRPSCKRRRYSQPHLHERSHAMSSSSKSILGLSGKKRAILEALLREQGIGEAKADGIPRRTESGPAELSFAQQRLWFLHQLEPESPLYNIHVAVELSGPLNVTVLQRSLGEISAGGTRPCAPHSL